MKAEEKARELVDRFEKLTDMGMIHLSKNGKSIQRKNAKQCALIAVDEILKLGFIFFSDAEKENNPEFWNEVKQEIERL